VFGQYNNAKKALDDEMIDSFMKAADKRTGPRSKEEIVEIIKKRNGYRLWRLRKDYKWLQREMRRLGYNPDDAKELL
jgi:hypothetical protein